MASRITPYLLYEDGAAAMDFIRDAFGFEEVLQSHSSEGRMWHGELRLGEDNVFVGEPGGDYKNPKRLGTTTVGIHVYVDDVDEHFERAKAAGAEIAEEPADQKYGDRRYTAKDPEGHHWFFATHVRDVAPEEWGAEVASSSST
jgi:PhnB protein